MNDVSDPPAVRGHLQTLWRFLLIGCANATIDTGIYLLLTAVGLELFLANLISTTCGLLFSFFANRTFTFRATPSDRRSAVVQFLLFFVVVGFGLWAIQPLVIIGVTAIIDSLTWLPSWIPAWILLTVPKLAAIGVALVWNYLLFHWVVFRRPAAATPEDLRNE